MIQQKAPFGNLEIIDVAKRRAQEVFPQNPEADFSVGFAEGVIQIGDYYFTSAWCVIADKEGGFSIGGGYNIELSQEMIFKFINGSLWESEIEMFLEKYVDKPFEDIVKFATIHRANP